MRFLTTTLLLISILSVTACTKDSTPAPIEEDIRLGGATSTEGVFGALFQQPAANLSATELEKHREADRAFGDIFVTAPSGINSGLGPIFNQNSCESCHIGNGRAGFPTQNNELGGLLFRLSVGGQPVPGFGGQLQDKAVYGKQPEAKVSIQTQLEIIQYLDGQSAQLMRPSYALSNPYQALPSNLEISPRIAPPVIGLGLLEAIKEADILALADENDRNGDGISGRANYILDVQTNSQAIGRFGWKASQPNLRQQTAAAYNNDMGITNPLFRREACAGQTQADSLADDPEIDDAILDAATFYTQSLAVPMRRNTDDADVKQGKALFLRLDCAKCHTPKFVTGQHPSLQFLSNQTIFPYTDMLLHDMGADLADNRPDALANGQEWRTPALWGIGLTRLVNGHTHFLHDGRARSLEEAILWHGGEAANARQQFKSLSQAERKQIILFLESL